MQALPHLHGPLQLLKLTLLSVQLALPITEGLLTLPNLAQSFSLELLLPSLQLLFMIRQLLSPCLQTSLFFLFVYSLELWLMHVMQHVPSFDARLQAVTSASRPSRG